MKSTAKKIFILYRISHKPEINKFLPIGYYTTEELAKSQLIKRGLEEKNPDVIYSVGYDYVYGDFNHDNK